MWLCSCGRGSGVLEGSCELLFGVFSYTKDQKNIWRYTSGDKFENI
jgi:hypothetical protein